ncbi:hypothetical protein [Candidatus Steffania adelgidicola]|uniref:hypothetical protein n=1 Tax=Candidatus Steffania adelgidicola TaxID=1076626 RepID=UPI001D0066C2|nr:hypothetical protein [Candidatus Steffania adelgidicola]
MLFSELYRNWCWKESCLAYHDRPDGGLLVWLAEIAFAGHCGIDVDIGTLGE